MTDNHGYETPQKGATEWHESLNRNFRYIDRDIEIRDIDAAKTNYRPKSGAKFLATDTEGVYIGDGNQWLRLSTSGQSPSFKTVSTKTIVDRSSGNGYSVDELASGGGGSVRSSEDAIITLEGGTPTAYRADGTQIKQNPDAATVLQAAVDTVGAGCIIIESGTFPIKSDVDFKSNQSIVGQGMGVTIFQCQETAQFTSTSSLSNLTLRDFTFDGNDQGGNTRMFFFGTPQNCSAIRLRIKNSGERSFTGQGNSAGGLGFRDGNGNKILNCHAHNCSNVALATAKFGKRNAIKNCLVTAPTRDGSQFGPHPISIESNVDSECSGNVVYGDGVADPCININAVVDCVCDGNVVYNGVKGINLANGSGDEHTRAVISNNVVTEMNNFGITVQDTSTPNPPEGSNIIGNIVKHIDQTGIKFRSDGSAHIFNNIVKNVNRNNENNQNGIAAAAEAPPVVVGNFVENENINIIGNTSGFGRKCFAGNNVCNRMEFFSPGIALGNFCDYLTFRGGDSIALGGVHSEKVKFTSQDNEVRFCKVGRIDDKSSDPANNNAQYNIGHTTENSGSAPVADGDTIFHGLAEKPTFVNVTTSVQGHIPSIGSVGESSLTVNLIDSSGSAVTNAETVYWEARSR